MPRARRRSSAGHSGAKCKSDCTRHDRRARGGLPFRPLSQRHTRCNARPCPCARLRPSGLHRCVRGPSDGLGHRARIRSCHNNVPCPRSPQQIGLRHDGLHCRPPKGLPPSFTAPAYMDRSHKMPVSPVLLYWGNTPHPPLQSPPLATPPPPTLAVLQNPPPCFR